MLLYTASQQRQAMARQDAKLCGYQTASRGFFFIFYSTSLGGELLPHAWVKFLQIVAICVAGDY
jgi:hypothetical protein